VHDAATGCDGSDGRRADEKGTNRTVLDEDPSHVRDVTAPLLSGQVLNTTAGNDTQREEAGMMRGDKTDIAEASG
jgi:hypothetical protein